MNPMTKEDVVQIDKMNIRVLSRESVNHFVIARENFWSLFPKW